MTMREAVLSLLLIAEERVGAPLRNGARMARAQEDAIAGATAAALAGVPDAR